MGRPLKPIDGEQVFKLAQLGCSYREIASKFDCDESLVRRRFSAEKERGAGCGDIAIRRWQMRRAAKGSDKMLIHLGMSRLDQSQKVDVNATGGITIRVVYEDDHTQVEPTAPGAKEGSP